MKLPENNPPPSFPGPSIPGSKRPPTSSAFILLFKSISDTAYLELDDAMYTDASTQTLNSSARMIDASTQHDADPQPIVGELLAELWNNVHDYLAEYEANLTTHMRDAKFAHDAIYSSLLTGLGAVEKSVYPAAKSINGQIRQGSSRRRHTTSPASRKPYVAKSRPISNHPSRSNQAQGQPHQVAKPRYDDEDYTGVAALRRKHGHRQSFRAPLNSVGASPMPDYSLWKFEDAAAADYARK